MATTTTPRHRQKIEQEQELLDHKERPPSLFLTERIPTSFNNFWHLPVELRLCVLEQLDPAENPREWLYLCDMEEYKPMADKILCKIIQERVTVVYNVEVYGSFYRPAPNNTVIGLPGQIRFETLPGTANEDIRNMIFSLAHRETTPQWKYKRDQRLIRQLSRRSSPRGRRCKPPPSSWDGAVVSLGDCMSSDKICSLLPVLNPKFLWPSDDKHVSYHRHRLWAKSHMAAHIHLPMSAEDVARRVLACAAQSLEAIRGDPCVGGLRKWLLIVNVDADRCFGGHLTSSAAMPEEIAKVLEENDVISHRSNLKGQDFLEVTAVSPTGLPASFSWVERNEVKAVLSVQVYMEDAWITDQ